MSSSVEELKLILVVAVSAHLRSSKKVLEHHSPISTLQCRHETFERLGVLTYLFRARLHLVRLILSNFLGDLLIPLIRADHHDTGFLQPLPPLFILSFLLGREGTVIQMSKMRGLQ